MWNRCLPLLFASLVPAALVSCHDDDPFARTPTFSIGGVVAGSTGVLTLQNSNGTTLTVAANGTFTFETPMVNGATYNVTVVVPPAAQTCEVINGNGTVRISDITHVAVSCTHERAPPKPGRDVRLAALTRD